MDVVVPAGVAFQIEGWRFSDRSIVGFPQQTSRFPSFGGKPDKNATVLSLEIHGSVILTVETGSLSNPSQGCLVMSQFNGSAPVQPILIAVDFEPASRAALVSGARLAQSTGTPIKILHVVHEPGDKPNYYQRHGAQDALLHIADLAESRLNEFLQDVYRRNPNLDVLEKPETLLVTGLPSTRIPEVAEREHAGLIIMGHCKASGLFGKLFSSLCERVAHTCTIPLTAVYPNGESEVITATRGATRQRSVAANVALGN
ncbi:MAG: universal stress protein [Gammaproteobacteria bacterium]|nr:universal stress protein [Gammaproteobacteria bacterium]